MAGFEGAEARVALVGGAGFEIWFWEMAAVGDLAGGGDGRARAASAGAAAVCVPGRTAAGGGDSRSTVGTYTRASLKSFCGESVRITNN